MKAHFALFPVYRGTDDERFASLGVGHGLPPGSSQTMIAWGGFGSMNPYSLAGPSRHQDEMAMNSMVPRYNHRWIDHIPAIWIDRVQASPRRQLAIWLPWFTGDKEAMMPYLTDLSQQGYVALSYDPWEHGETARESTEALCTRVFGNYRRYMWPILAHTVEDILASCPDKLQVNLYAGVGHQSTAEMWQSSLAWFARAQAQRASANG